MTKYNASRKINESFKRAVDGMVSNGVNKTVARNVIRWKNQQRNVARRLPEWKNLESSQWKGPAARLAQKVKDGTRSGSPMPTYDPDSNWNNATILGMVNVKGTLYASALEAKQ